MTASVIAEVALPVFAFYLLVACNYVKEIFGCGLQTMLDQNIYAKHVVAILLLFFLVVIINPEYADQQITRNVLLTLGIYAWFLITTRTPVYVMLVVLVLLLASYIMSLARKRQEEEKDDVAATRSRILQHRLAVSAFVFSVFGFVLYAIEKKREYKSKFAWSKFFSGNLSCRGYTPAKAKVLPL